MVADREFQFKKSQIENYVKSEFEKQFDQDAKISVRKRQKFMSELTRRIGEKFGKDVLCLIDYTRHGFVSIISPAHTQSTDKGRLYQSFSHPQVYYTSHCIDRFSQRTQTAENCVITLDSYLTEAILTYGIHEGHMVCLAGVFAYELEDERLIVKTYINYELLTDKQIAQFYGAEMFSMLNDDIVSDDFNGSDFVLSDERQ